MRRAAEIFLLVDWQKPLSIQMRLSTSSSPLPTSNPYSPPLLLLVFLPPPPSSRSTLPSYPLPLSSPSLTIPNLWSTTNSNHLSKVPKPQNCERSWTDGACPTKRSQMGQTDGKRSLKRLLFSLPFWRVRLGGKARKSELISSL